MNLKTTDAKASLTSNKSMSLMSIPAAFRTRSVAGIGPVSIIVGSVPILLVALNFARGFRLFFSPYSLLPIRIAAAPSAIPDELPAW